ncbi:MAG: hypothetical protein HYY01_10020 [Chloroflexi bacterium]|nr:hypothetical protein [Chloroflexota bacterium]
MTARKGLPVPIKNAEEASDVVKRFLAKMGETVFMLRRAEKTDSIWIVEFGVGFRTIRFEVDANTGEILKYTQLN